MIAATNKPQPIPNAAFAIQLVLLSFLAKIASGLACVPLLLAVIAHTFLEIVALAAIATRCIPPVFQNAARVPPIVWLQPTPFPTKRLFVFLYVVRINLPSPFFDRTCASRVSAVFVWALGRRNVHRLKLIPNVRRACQRSCVVHANERSAADRVLS